MGSPHIDSDVCDRLIDNYRAFSAARFENRMRGTFGVACIAISEMFIRSAEQPATAIVGDVIGLGMVAISWGVGVWQRVDYEEREITIKNAAQTG